MSYSKGKSKVKCKLGNNGKILRGPCVTVAQEKRNSSTEKMSEK